MLDLSRRYFVTVLGRAITFATVFPAARAVADTPSEAICRAPPDPLDKTAHALPCEPTLAPLVAG